MVILEFREAVLNRAFEELDEAKEGMEKANMALCNVEDALCEIYEYSEDEKHSEKEYSENGDTYEAEVTGNDIEVNYRRRRGMRGGMRRGMRGSMRMRRNVSNRYTY